MSREKMLSGLGCGLGVVLLGLVGVLFFASPTATRASQTDTTVNINTVVSLGVTNCTVGSTLDIPVTMHSAGTFSSNCQELSVATNGVGYQLSAQANDSGSCTGQKPCLYWTGATPPVPLPFIPSTTDLPSAPGILTTNTGVSPATGTWGFAVPSGYADNSYRQGGFTFPDVANYTTSISPLTSISDINLSTVSANTKFARLPHDASTLLAEADGLAAPNHTIAIFYGAAVPQLQAPGTYQATVTYTAVGVDPPPPPLCASGAENVNLCQVDIDDNMVPIAYDGSKWKAVSTTEAGGGWYNYDNKQWANAVTVVDPTKYIDGSGPIVGTEIDEDDVLGYWVYVPRYAYEVMRHSAIDAPIATPENFDIKFEKATDVKKAPADSCSSGTPGDGVPANHKDYRTACGHSRDYGAATGTTWTTHPAFSFGAVELNGIWIGKFNATGTNTAPTVKPNQHANIYETGGRQYDLAKSIGVENVVNNGGAGTALTRNQHHLTSFESSMLKNRDYGAAAYLSASEFGAGVGNVKPNTAYPSTSADADGRTSRFGITGCGPTSAGSNGVYTDGTALSVGTIASPTACSGDTSRAYNGAVGQLASTTNNIYGIYDLSGGANIMTVAARGGLANFGTMPPAAYYDNYPTAIFNTPPAGSDSRVWAYGYDVCTFQYCGGHSLHEVLSVQAVTGDRQSWTSNYSHFGAWFARGGHVNDGPTGGAGVFYSYEGNGSAQNANGYFVVLFKNQ
ncbi:MAG: hypothetical protein LBC95_01595 [Candidatus Nomurabacteria bacterium]|nr:hypothetical protein [Candidatus Nomurabacteria bacterium]